jgi:type II secretory pathway component GspD/PulD (secretin)
LQSRHDYSLQANVPFFSQIPVLGELFKYRANESAETEIVFLITPSLII